MPCWGSAKSSFSTLLALIFLGGLQLIALGSSDAGRQLFHISIGQEGRLERDSLKADFGERQK